MSLTYKLLFTYLWIASGTTTNEVYPQTFTSIKACEVIGYKVAEEPLVDEHLGTGYVIGFTCTQFVES